MVANAVASSVIRPSEARPGQRPALSGEQLLRAYRTMALTRTLDERAWLLNRQGKAAIVPSSQGHEAVQIACALATDPRRDHYLIYYRQLPLLLALGVPPASLLKSFLAKAGEPFSGARQFPFHGALNSVDAFKFSGVVGAQLPQAAGVALADRLQGSDAVTIVFFGDGASSQGDCHEAMNFASIHRLPVVFLCENNGYAISVPLHRQVASGSIAARAEGYGFPGVTVDGADVCASYESIDAAVRRARGGSGPTLVEAIIERILPHTTDDDQTKYRTAHEIQRARDRDPVRRLAALLRERGLLDEREDSLIWNEAKRAVNDANREADQAPFPDPGSLN